MASINASLEAEGGSLLDKFILNLMAFGAAALFFGIFAAFYVDANYLTELHGERMTERARAQMADRVARGLPPVDPYEVQRAIEQDAELMKRLVESGLV